MRTFTAFAGCLMVLVAVALAQDAGEADKKALQGEWDVVAFYEDGKKADRGEKKMKLVIKGDELIPYEDGKAEDPAKFVIDAGKTPKLIDITETKGAKKTMKGIYELKGDGLKIAVGEKDRPKEFGDEDVIWLELKRAK